MKEYMEEYIVDSDGVPARIRIIDGTDYVPHYEVDRPIINEATEAILEEIKSGLVREVTISIKEYVDSKELEGVKEKFIAKANELIKSVLPRVGEAQRKVLIGNLIHEMLGLGDLEILLNDDKLEEIVINSSKEPVWVYHKKLGWLKTNIIPKSESETYNYSSIIGRRVGRQISNLNPLLDAHLPSGDRTNATIFPISTKGNTLTIRKFARSPWTITDFIENHTISADIAALIWLCMQYELNVLISGGTGSGKCVSGDTQVLLSNGELKRIKDVVDENLSSNCVPSDDGWYSKQTSVSLFSMNSNLKLNERSCSQIWKREAPEYLFELTFQSGKKIKVTPEHPFFVNDAGDIRKICAEDLTTGQRAATTRKINIKGEVYSLEEKLSNLSFFRQKEKDYVLLCSPKGLPVKFPTKLSPELAKFIAYLLGDGHLSKDGSQLAFHNTNHRLLNEFQNLGEKLFDINFHHKKPKNRVECIRCYSKTLCETISQVFCIPKGVKSHRILVPKEILGGTEEIICGFVKALMDCEGSVSLNKDEIEFGSKSSEIVNQLQYLLNRIGIISRVKFGKNNRNRLFISSRDVRIFTKKIGFTHPLKKDKLEQLLTKKLNPNFDLLPCQSLLKKVCNNFSLYDKEVALGSKLSRRSISRYLDGSRMPSPANLQRIYNFLTHKNDQIKQELERFSLVEGLIKKIPEKEALLHCTKILDLTHLNTNDILFKSGLSNSIYWQWKQEVTPYTKNLVKFGNCVVDSFENFEKNVMNAETLEDFTNCGIYKKEIAEYAELPLNQVYKKSKINKPLNHLQLDAVKLQESVLLEEVRAEAKKLKEILSSWDKKDYQAIFSEIVRLRNLLRLYPEKTKKDLGYSIPQSTESVVQYSKEKLTGISNYLRETLEQMHANGTKLLRNLENLVKSDVLWDKIVTIKQIKSTEKWVYDLTVPDTHNFVANGIIAHNTSLLNVLMPFIPANQRIVSIEDTREIQLPNFLHWVPLTTRQQNPEGKGKVSMLDLLVNSLRMRPDRIIVGEIRRKRQAEVLFEAMHTGHSVYSTLHADTAQQTIRRLINPPIDVPVSMISAIDLNVVMFRDRRRNFRRVMEVAEVIPEFQGANSEANANIIYRWHPKSDVIRKEGRSIRVNSQLELHAGLSQEEIRADIAEKVKILNWMVKENIRDIEEVGKLIAEYYKDKTVVLNLISKPYHLKSTKVQVIKPKRVNSKTIRKAKK